MLQDNNVIALGLEDAVVAIYNVRLDVVQHSMKAHEAAVTGAKIMRAASLLLYCFFRRLSYCTLTEFTAHAGLAFVGNGKHLVSGGRDASVCFWSPSKDSGEKFIAERIARLQSAYEGSDAPSAGPPVNVRITPLHTCDAFPTSC